jgi:hypothetical protein
MPCDAQTLINEAVSQGYDQLDDHSLKAAILQLICNGGGGGGGGVWGSITGTLSDQTDLQSALDDKLDKLLPSANVFVGNAGGEAAAVPLSGDIGINDSGVTSIQPGVITNADISASAAISRDKIAADLAAPGELLFNDETTGRITSSLMMAVTTAGLGRFYPLGMTLRIASASPGGTPLKFQGGALVTTPEAGALEALNTGDDIYYTIATGPARKKLVMADPTGGLTSGRVPYTTTNGRLTDTSVFTYDPSVGGGRLSVNRILLAAGSATAGNAPLKFTTGTLLSTPEAGAVEYSSDALYLTINTGTARKRVVLSDMVSGFSTGSVPFANSTGRLTESPRLYWDNSNNSLYVKNTAAQYLNLVVGGDSVNSSAFIFENDNFPGQQWTFAMSGGNWLSTGEFVLDEVGVGVAIIVSPGNHYTLIGQGTSTPEYQLDVQGDGTINALNGYYISGTPGATDSVVAGSVTLHFVGGLFVGYS